MNLTHLLRAALAALSLAGLATAARAATAYDGWANMSGSGYSSFGSSAWGSTIGSNVAGSGDAELGKVSGTAYGGGTYGIQTAAAASTLTLFDNTPLSGLSSISLSLTWLSATSTGGTPVLNLNGGTQAFAPVASPISGTTLTYTWDVSGFGQAITAFDIDFTIAAFKFATLTGADLTQTAVPEPSACAALAGLGVLALAAGRRRRA